MARQRDPALRRPGRLPCLRLLVGLALAASLFGCRLESSYELLARRDPRVVWTAGAPAQAVALTLDDGPDAETTPRLLEVLAAYEARATFFLLGDEVRGREAVVEAIVDQGHEIANHMTRDEPSIDLSPETFEAELLRADAILKPFGVSRWFRPGSGWYADWMFPILERHDYRMVLGAAYPLDAWLRSVRLVHWLARHQVDPGDVLVLHDGGRRGARSAEVLGRLLPDLASRGLRVVTLSELLGIAR